MTHPNQRRVATRTRAPYALLLAAAVAAPTPATAQTPAAPRAEAHGAVRVRPTAALGGVLALVGLDSYGIALHARVGADVAFPGSASHSLAVTLGWTPYNVRGARLDLVVLDAGWRWRPSPALGFFTLLSVGAAAARESLDVTLGAQRIDESAVYVGGAAAVSVGWTLFDHVDVELSYRQALLAMGTADGPGSFGGSIGGRL
ncbi:MAG: hypothetical protein U0324_27965 [Polyangiales bacterium]